MNLPEGWGKLLSRRLSWAGRRGQQVGIQGKLFEEEKMQVQSWRAWEVWPVSETKGGCSVWLRAGREGRVGERSWGSGQLCRASWTGDRSSDFRCHLQWDGKQLKNLSSRTSGFQLLLRKMAPASVWRAFREWRSWQGKNQLKTHHSCVQGSKYSGSCKSGPRREGSMHQIHDPFWRDWWYLQFSSKYNLFLIFIFIKKTHTEHLGTKFQRSPARPLALAFSYLLIPYASL